MCEAFWSVKPAQHTFDISWEDLSDLLNPGLVMTLETSGREVQRRRHGIYPRVSIPLITPISPKDFVTELEIDINDDNELKLTNETDLCKLTKELPAVLRFPRLRRTAINLWIPGDCDCYWEVMPLVESISTTCQELQLMIGTNLSVWILRDWPHHRSTFKCMDHDISWMWEVPGQEVRMIRGVRAPTAAEDRVRTMMSIDFRPMNLKKSLLQELRDAASSFSQRREESATEEGGLKGEI